MDSGETDTIGLRTLPETPQATEIESSAERGLRSRSSGFQDEANNPQAFSLAPTDSGKAAWLVLFGAFATEALLWGFLFSFGVFQEYYSKTEPFASEASGVALIGTCATGISYIGGLFAFPIFQRWPQLRLYSFYAGMPVLIVSLVAASFASHVSHLILTQGILYGLGGTLLYNPVILFLQEWFVRRRGLAFGIMWSGTGIAGVTIPFILSALLDRFGWRTALRAWATAVAVFAVPLLLSVKPRLPVSGTVQQRRFDLHFFSSHTFWILQMANVVQGLGYFMPAIYLPSYASAINLDPTAGTLALALVNAASCLACPVVGTLVDRFHVSTITFVISIVAALSAFVLWGFSVSTPTLAVFSVLYGVSAGCYSTTYTGVVKEIQNREPGADTGIMFGFLSAGRGLGAVISGPLSEALLGLGAWQDSASFGYGTKYGSLIVLTGTTAAAGGLSWCARRVGWM